jgi:hypothetical protein
MARQDGGGSIPIYSPPKKPKATATKKPLTSSKPKAAAPRPLGTGGSKGGSKGGGGGGYNSYLASQKKAQSKAATRYLNQAKAMSGQIAALKNSLSVGFKAALDQRLANISLVSGQQDDLLLEGYNKRVKSLEGAAADNEKAEGATSFANLGNAARERANAVSEAMNQGAGESDVLRAGLMSLRNWSQNQDQANRSYFDTLRSVNSSLGDLNVDTKTGRANIASQANADRDQVWSQFHQQKSETFSNLGNLFGQQSELYGMANEQKGSKATQRLRKQAVSKSDSAFMSASKQNATVWSNPGVGSEILNWQGRDDFAGDIGPRTIEQATTNEPVKARPEGATLRKWTV